MEDFDRFWAAYPKKRKKPDARKAWKQTEAVRPPVDQIISVVQAYCKTQDWIKNDGAFIPYPATFIRAEQWDDEIEVKLPGIVNEKPWQETASGIETKGAELGLTPAQFSSWQHFRHAVLTAAKPKLKAVS